MNSSEWDELKDFFVVLKRNDADVVVGGELCGENNKRIDGWLNTLDFVRLLEKLNVEVATRISKYGNDEEYANIAWKNSLVLYIQRIFCFVIFIFGTSKRIDFSKYYYILT